MDKMKNKSKVPTTTIFKLVGACEILSHGQEVTSTVFDPYVIHLKIH